VRRTNSLLLEFVVEFRTHQFLYLKVNPGL
jgi:hypothetical protein